ncbi:MAG: FAD-dependent oxidoreductase, partial [Chloroflexi bacterium]|nr:FAD-dependent oxidoreductase [Chloroflexota bacterium]
MTTTSEKTIVLGAGPAGLAAAFELVRHDRAVDVVERAEVVGGLARTVERDGYRFDIGGHRWFSKDDELNQLFRALLGDEVVNVDRISRIYYDGRYVDYPLRLGNVLRNIGLSLSARAVADYAVVVVRPPVVAGEQTMEDAYVAQFGRALYERFFRDYSEKVWGDDCRRLSGDWVVQRSKGMSLLTAVKDAVRPSKDRVESLVERFMYPRLGYGRLSERLAEETRAGGGRVTVGARVTAVRHGDGRIRAIVVRGADGHETTLEGDQFISSIPMPALARLLRPAAPDGVLAAADKLTFRDLITVNLMLRREQITRDTWLYIHDPGIPFGRLHEPKNWSAAMVPDAAHTSIVAEYFCSIGDEIWAQSDEALCELTVHHLSRTLGFIEPNEVVGGFAVRSPRAYPTYRLGYREPLGELKAYA